MTGTTTASPVAAVVTNAPAVLLDLFAAGVCAAELREPGDIDTLSERERRCVANAVLKRVQEFAAGRQCARAALAQLGITDFQLLAAADRQPLWPAGVIGSITHTRGYCAAVVASRARFAGLGLDAEQAQVVHEALWPQICTSAELTRLGQLPPSQRVRVATLMFSAKEAFYKAQYPLTGEWLHFRAVEVQAQDWLAASGSFEVRPRRQLVLEQHEFASVTGRFVFDRQFVIAAVALPRTLLAGPAGR